MKRFLRPVIGVATALALGVGATFVGIQFAAPQTVTAPSTQVEAPVIAPIGEGSEQPGDELISTVVGTDTITEAGTAPTELPADLLDTITTIESAEDPAYAVTVHEDEEAAAVAGDPCAPAEGTAAEDCPEGLHSTILALEGVRALYVAGQAFPQTQAEYQETTTFTLYPWCPAVEYGEGEVPFGIFSTAPADIQVTYWPSADPADVATATTTTSDADRAAYSAAQAAGTEPWEMPTPRHCITLSGLLPDTAYTAEVRVLDIFDRVNTPTQTWFNSGGELGIPSPQLTTLGDNFVFASMLHSAHERVAIRGIWLPEDDDGTSCSTPSTVSTLVHESESTVSDEYLLEHGVLPEYTERVNATFVVPAGVRFLVCVRVFPAGDGVPSWEADHPDQEARIVVLTPDFQRPTITVEALEIQRGSTVVMEAATTEGIPCGERLANREAGYPGAPFDLCSGSRITGAVVLPDELRNYGHRGDIAIKSAITPQSGSTVTKDSVLSLGVHPCEMLCVAPSEQWFRLALGETNVERALIHVTWAQAGYTGAQGWQIPPITMTSPDYVAPELPIFDHDAVPEFQVNWDSKSVSMTWPLTVDRPVDYTVQVGETPSPTDVVCTSAPGATTSASGHVDGTAEVYLYGLCLGQGYYLDVTLTEADGTSVRYGHLWGADSYVDLPITTPGWDGELVWQIDIDGPDNTQVRGLYLAVNGTRLIPAGEPVCSADGALSMEGTTDVTLGQQNWISASAQFYSSCDDPDELVRTAGGSAYLSIDDIQWGSADQGAWVHYSDYVGTSIHLWMDDFR